ETVGDGAYHAGEPAAQCEHAALHVDRDGAARRMQPPALGLVVDEGVGGEHRPGPRTLHAEAGALPKRHAGPVDDTRGVEHVADAKLVAQGAGEPERHEPAVGEAGGATHADPRRAQSQTLRDAFLRRRGDGKRQPVSVHARLRTVSFRLFEASYAAEGSNPQWIPQCSQRGSFPGPYASHSMPSSSAS